MLTPQYVLPLAHELVVDLFAGGGGASTGIEQAIGRPVDIAVNHDREAVSLHEANHPQTRHFCEDVFKVDPLSVVGDQRVGLLWASPDCKHFSKAKGGKPVSKKIRGLAGVVIEWVKRLKPFEQHPRVIHLENVEEFQTWGPLLKNDRPCPRRKGRTFQHWVQQLRALGYSIEWRELRACDYGAPTIRKRLFIIARCDGLPIVWPAPTHGPGLRPYRVAADCIDWSIPCPSIFERDRELAAATLRRIAHGIKRYVLESAKPFIVRIGHTGHGDGGKARSIDEPLSTITSKAEHLLALPTLVQTGYGERPGQAPRVPGLDKPLGTCVDGQKHALVAAFLAKHYGGNETPGWPLDKAISTITTQDHHHLVTSHLLTNTTRHAGGPTDAPLHTVTTGGHHAEVRALLLKYYGTDQDPQLGEPLHTVTTKDRFGLVTVHGEDYFIADIGMRMLQPRELYRAQGFPDSYVIDRGANGKPLSKAAQVRMCGNSVCPPLARAIVAANYAEQQVMREAA